ncbi:hypothetical protein AYI70_g5282 [Smittium culicis]|uniref:Uncharacterized protein n=1 Tax=Smittium culicis TaxID=133412 RepID=A0A1R1XV96_9FUNG|nr:hypothetical protein AYI70_g9522 [Smittium culicis]OMJ18583.1 hypothetical protein AYI70_g5282 [Smittium culicis]
MMIFRLSILVSTMFMSSEFCNGNDDNYDQNNQAAGFRHRGYYRSRHVPNLIGNAIYPKDQQVSNVLDNLEMKVFMPDDNIDPDDSGEKNSKKYTIETKKDINQNITNKNNKTANVNTNLKAPVGSMVNRV